MVLRGEPGPELIRRPYDGINFPPQIVLNVFQPSDGFSRSDWADDQEIHVASGHRAS
jgi:hypothetical protein